jgi:methyl coenzyme M reductase alpha subunit
MPDNAERMRRTISTLPEALLSEVLDFAEFLSAKQARLNAQPADVSLGALCGGLSDSAAFSDSPTRV